MGHARGRSLICSPSRRCQKFPLLRYTNPVIDEENRVPHLIPSASRDEGVQQPDLVRRGKYAGCAAARNTSWKREGWPVRERRVHQSFSPADPVPWSLRHHLKCEKARQFDRQRLGRGIGPAVSEECGTSRLKVLADRTHLSAAKLRAAGPLTVPQHYYMDTRLQKTDEGD